MEKARTRTASGTRLARQVAQAKGARLVVRGAPSTLTNEQKIWNEIVNLKRLRKKREAEIKAEQEKKK